MHQADELEGQILTHGAARFSHGEWVLSPTGDDSRLDKLHLSKHEELHQALNDLTTFGLVLEAVAVQSRAADKEGWSRYERLLKGLVPRCRTTHETFATYLSLWQPWGDGPSQDLSQNPEYSGYFATGDALASLLPTRPLGALALTAVVRVSMNGPLPEALISGGFDSLALKDFRAADAPDHRFFECLRFADAEFWQAAYEDAKARFGSHPQWRTIIDNRDRAFNLDWLFKMTPDESSGQLFVAPGGVDPELETAVGNLFVDRLAEQARGRGIESYTRVERLEIEARVREHLSRRLPRTNDYAGRVERFKHERLLSKEKILFRDRPQRTYVKSLSDISQDDWAAYSRIVKDEGFLPVYLRSVEDVMRNHRLEGAELPSRDGVVCFLRKQRREPDESIALDLHLIEEPQRLRRLLLHADFLGGELGLRVAGSLLVEKFEAAAGWLVPAHGAQTSVILDAHPQDILDRLNQDWEFLTWHIERLEEGGGQDVLFLFPVAVGPVPPIGFFRPGTYASGDAALLLLRQPAVPLSAKNTGVNITGLTEAVVKKSWDFPLHLVWAAKRWLDEEYIFSASPGKSEEV